MSMPTSRPATSRRALCAALSLLPVLAGSATRGLAAPSTPRSEIEAPWDQGGDIPVSGGTLHWRARGDLSDDRPPLVLLHKLGGWIADWRKIAPLLAGERAILAFDLPGHGHSAMYGPPPYVQSVAESAAMLVSALDYLEIREFSLAGNSLGGVIAIAMAAYWPQRVRDLSLIAVSLASGRTLATLRKQEQRRDPKVWTPDWRPLARTREQTAIFGTIDPSVDTEQNASRARADRWVRPSERGAALIDIAQLLGRTRCPVQAMVPMEGPYASYAEVPRAQRPDADLVRMGEAGSFLPQEAPARVARELIRFWDHAGI